MFMLLSSVTKHVKDQNWFAVIVDFFIVVVGVFVGLQVTNWNDSLTDQEVGNEYIQRIHRDINTDIESYELRMRFWNQVLDYGSIGLAYIEDEGEDENEEASKLSNWEVLLAFFQASQIWEFSTANATFSELTSAGDLRLIKNVHIRNTLTNYYANSANLALSERPSYREHVRGIIPIAVQSYIWQNCYKTQLNIQYLKACQSPIDESRAKQIIDGISTNEALMNELRYWVSSMNIAIIIGNSRLEEANALRLSIEEEIGNSE